jgi:hypothetical protein
VLADWLADFTYWDGYAFSLHEHEEGPVLWIEFSVPDSRNPGQIQDQRVKTYIPPVTNADQFYRWLKWRLNRIAIHEVGEGFRVKGELIYDPHQD